MERPRLPAEERVHRLGLGEQEQLGLLVKKVLRREVETAVINTADLLFYLDAASRTGFTVTKIADEGEEFPWLSMKLAERGREQEYNSDGTPKVVKIKVQGKDYIAVSIEKPAGSKDHSYFWTTLSLERDYFF